MEIVVLNSAMYIGKVDGLFSWLSTFDLWISHMQTCSWENVYNSWRYKINYSLINKQSCQSRLWFIATSFPLVLGLIVGLHCKIDVTLFIWPLNCRALKHQNLPRWNSSGWSDKVMRCKILYRASCRAMIYSRLFLGAMLHLLGVIKILEWTLHAQIHKMISVQLKFDEVTKGVSSKYLSGICSNKG